MTLFIAIMPVFSDLNSVIPDPLGVHLQHIGAEIAHNSVREAVFEDPMVQILQHKGIFHVGTVEFLGVEVP